MRTMSSYLLFFLLFTAFPQTKPEERKVIAIPTEVNELIDDFLLLQKQVDSRKALLCERDTECTEAIVRLKIKANRIAEWEKKNVPEGYAYDNRSRTYVPAAKQ